MMRKQMCVGAVVGGSLLLAAGANAAIVGMTCEFTTFDNGYVLADGSIAAGTTTSVGEAWATFGQQWDVYRLWATVDSALSTVGGVGGSVDNNIDFILDAGNGAVFYNHPVFDSDSSQNPATFTVPAFANAAFDTFVTVGADDGSSAPLITEPNNEFNGFQSSINCQNCGWTTTPAAGLGVVSGGETGFRVLLGQFTVTEGSFFFFQGNVAGGGQIVYDGHPIPGPVGLGVFAIAAMVGPRRRRG